DLRCCHAETHASCTASRASASDPRIARAIRYVRGRRSVTSASNASSSPSTAAWTCWCRASIRRARVGSVSVLSDLVSTWVRCRTKGNGSLRQYLAAVAVQDADSSSYSPRSGGQPRRDREAEAAQRRRLTGRERHGEPVARRPTDDPADRPRGAT